MPKSKGVFERYIEAAERTGDIMLSYFSQKEAIRQQLFSSQEREQLVMILRKEFSPAFL